jgi:DNA polymerase-3 subunit delta
LIRHAHLYRPGRPRALERARAVWLIAGDEPLLTGRQRTSFAPTRKEGFTGRDLFVTDRSFDWSEVAAASRALSLFSERRILEIRMPTARPGKEGGAALAALAADPGPDNLVLVITARPEKEAWSSAWLKAFEKHGVFVQSSPVEIGKLPQWISGRASKAGLTLDPGAAEFLAERVEGNLLAAQQEIEKLALLTPAGRVSMDAMQAAVANSARYSVYQLGEAALDGDAPRSLRILEGLRVEGAEPPLVLWALCRELRALADVRNGIQKKSWGANAERHEALVSRAAKRTARQPIGPWFVAAAQIDRQFKGQAGKGGGDPWTSLTALVADIAGAKLASAQPRG